MRGNKSPVRIILLIQRDHLDGGLLCRVLVGLIWGLKNTIF